MVRVAPIKMATGSRALWFDPGDLEIHKGDSVVVLTARGVEFGEAADDIVEVSDEEIQKLKSPLKPVKRLATPEDAEKAVEMARLSDEALPIFKEMAAESGAEMRPIAVEYLLDGDKAVFYFEADERVDFRDLVRKLAARFHVRVDMRQIGVRDEARMVGGLGHCGQELCCKRLGGEFCPVSIRMAKEQDLSLNPQKISGVCGRLMCCLRYEYDAYKDFKSRAPKANATVQTPDGPAKVVDLDVPREVVSLKVGDEKPVKVPLRDFEPANEGTRPNCVGAEAWDRATAEGDISIMGEATFLTSQFTGSDKLAEAGSVRHTGASKPSRGAAAGGSDEATPSRKPRRRRSTKVGDAGAVETASAAKQKTAAPKKDAAEKQAPTPKKRQRSRGSRPAGTQGNAVDQQKRDTASTQASSSGKRRNQEGRKQAKGTGQDNAAKAPAAKLGPRPGQKSSALRNRQSVAPQADGSTKGGEQNAPRRSRSRRGPSEGSSDAAEASGASEHRRVRRRSHRAGGSAEAQ